MKTLSDCHILIADDSPDSLFTLECLLENICHIHPTTSASEALELAAKISPDLCLLDVVMPGQDGFDICKALKANPRTAHTPVIFLTSRNDSNDKISGFSAGGVDYVTKPFEAAEILMRIKTHLRLSLYDQEQRNHIKYLAGAVRDTEESYLFFANNTADLLVQGSADGTLKRINRAWIELTGLEEGVPIGRPIWDIAILSDHEMVKQMFQNAVSENAENFRITFRLASTRGTRSLSGAFRLCRSKNGSLLGFNGVLSDITELQADRDALETALISGRSLAAADLAYLENISHEFNTPLNFINGGVEQLKSLVSDGPSHAAVSLVEQGLSKIKTLIGGLLDQQMLTTQAASGVFSSNHGEPISEMPLEAAVLIVDDVRTNRMILSFAVKALGFSDIEMAESGEEALALWEKRKHALVFLDYKMRGIDGYETCQRIRRAQAGLTPTIIGVSASARPENIQTAMLAGFSAQLPKPISKQIIGSTLAMLGWKLPGLEPNPRSES